MDFEVTEDVIKTIAELADLTRGALAEMRALIFELRPEALAEEGLVGALRKQSAAISAREQVIVSVEADDQRVPLDPDLEEHLFRIVSEALNNVIKHARADSATVQIVQRQRQMRIVVSDDGVGFDKAHDHAGHMGLSTMAERAGAIGAELAVNSSPGDGTTVTVSVRVPEIARGTVISE